MGVRRGRAVSVTIKDISQHLGISISTVSKALNGYPDVSVETRAAVSKAADELGYYPSALARNLRLQRTGKIGLIHPSKTFESETYTGFFRGLTLAAEGFDTNLILYNTPTNDPATLRRIGRSREVDGMVLMGTGIAGAQSELIALLQRDRIPFVVLGNPVDDPTVPFVAADNRTGALEAVRHLIGQGRRRIAYLARSDDPENSDQRQRGYRQALDEAGIAFDPRLLVDVPYAPYSGMGAMRMLLELPSPPDAVFAFNDHIAIDAAQTAVERGLRLPDDVAIAGFDNIPSSLITTPAITTVHLPQREMGVRALDLLTALIAGNADGPHQITFATQLMVRASTVGGGAAA